MVPSLLCVATLATVVSSSARCRGCAQPAFVPPRRLPAARRSAIALASDGGDVDLAAEAADDGWAQPTRLLSALKASLRGGESPLARVASDAVERLAASLAPPLPGAPAPILDAAALASLLDAAGGGGGGAPPPEPAAASWELISRSGGWERLVEEASSAVLLPLLAVVEAADLTLTQTTTAIDGLLASGSQRGAELLRSLPPPVAELLLEASGEPRNALEAQLGEALRRASEPAARTVVNWAGEETHIRLDLATLADAVASTARAGESWQAAAALPVERAESAPAEPRAAPVGAAVRLSAWRAWRLSLVASRAERERRKQAQAQAQAQAQQRGSGGTEESAAKAAAREAAADAEPRAEGRARPGVGARARQLLAAGFKLAGPGADADARAAAASAGAAPSARAPPPAPSSPRLSAAAVASAIAWVEASVLLAQAPYNLRLRPSDPFAPTSAPAASAGAAEAGAEALLAQPLERPPSSAPLPPVAAAAAAAATLGAEQRLPEAVAGTIERLVERALGSGTGSLALSALISDRACAVVALPAPRPDGAAAAAAAGGAQGRRPVAVVSFRGTKEVWPDLLTDATFLPRAFVPPGGDGGGGLLVHGGFLAAFETVRPALEQVLSRVPAGCDVLFVGHSMGGSIAQIAAATFWARRPQLITFGAPATGNSEFAAHVNAHAQPNGGLRCWNQADVIVTIAMAAGYRHNGISLPGLARPGAIAAYEQARAGPAVPGIALAAPHVLYQLGGHVYAFPVLWSDSPPRAGGALRPPAADAADAAIAAADEAAAMRASAEQGRVASAVGAGAVQLGDDGYDGVADGPVLVA